MKQNITPYFSYKEAMLLGMRTVKADTHPYSEVKVLASGQRVKKSFLHNNYNDGIKGSTFVGVLPVEPLILNVDESVYKYSDNSDELHKVLESEETKVIISVTFLAKRKHFEDDSDERNVFLVRIERPNRRRDIKYEFGSSINDTAKGLCPTYYDILAIARREFYCPVKFSDFCDEYGYDVDSIKAKKIWKRCLEMSGDLQNMFTEAEIENFPS